VKPTLEEYLQQISRFAGSKYGRLIRSRFADMKGTSELAMLAAPTVEELRQLEKAVAIMTPQEKQNADELSDSRVQQIAAEAGIDPAALAIFINGYALHCKRVP